MTRLFRARAVATLPLIALGLWAFPATATDVPPSRPMAMLSDAQLDAARGGFSWSGMSISFGADTQTFLNGKLVLQTSVQWSNGGVTTVTTIGGELTPAALAHLPSHAGGLTIPLAIAGNQVFLANGGQTALVQGSNGGLQNVLFNTAAGLNASQTTNAMLSIGNYAAFASALHSQAIGSALGAQIAGVGR